MTSYGLSACRLAPAWLFLYLFPLMTRRERKRRGEFRGPILKSTGPIATAAVNAHVSMRSFATLFEVSYSAVKMWDARKSAPDAVRAALRGAPYNVPPSAWT